MDLAIQFPCAYPLIEQGFRRANHQIVDATSPRFGKSISRTGFNGDRRIQPQVQTSSSSTSMGRFKKGSVCCTKQPDEQTSNPSKLNQEEIISLLRRIQSSISKGKSQGAKKKKNQDESSENEPPLSKAILDVLEKPRKKTEGHTGVTKEPPSSIAKRSPSRPSASNPPRGKLPVTTKSDKALEETIEKEEKPPLIETMKLAELKEVAKNRGIKGYSKLKKNELLNLLKSS